VRGKLRREWSVMNNIYILELVIWIGLVLFTIFLFRFFSRKMKHTDNQRTKGSLFTIMLLFGLPLILFEVIAPIVILMAEGIMPVGYKIAFGCEILIVIIYFFSTQRSNKSK